MSDTETNQQVPAPSAIHDPVCGMSVDPAQARGRAQHQGESYYFCSPGCMHKFVSDPGKYLSPSYKPGGMSSEATVQIGASCKIDRDPVCGMNVDPANAAASVEYEHKLYHFCCKGCAEKFKADPQKYLAPSYSPGGMSHKPQMVSIGGFGQPMTAPQAAARSGLRHECRSGESGRNVRPQRQDLLLLLPRLRREVQGRPRKVSVAPAGDESSCPSRSSVSGGRPSGSVPWVRRCARPSPAPVPSAAWRWSPRFPSRRDQDRSGPAPCIPRSCATGRAACPICGMALEPTTVTAARGRESRTARHDAPLLDRACCSAFRWWPSRCCAWGR